jgi:hypothetical protein
VQRLQADDDAGARVGELVTQPACQAAWIAITVAGPFCSISASRSPGRRPSSRSDAASAQARSAASRKLIGVSK